MNVKIRNLKHDVKPIMREQWMELRLQWVAPVDSIAIASDS